MISRRKEAVYILAVLFTATLFGLAFAQGNTEEVPKINCQEALKYLNSDEYYCKWPDRPPVRKMGGQEVADKEKSYEFNYTGEVQTMSGNIISIEGDYSGMHKSYDEAVKACENYAKTHQKMLSPADHILSLECKPTSVDGEPIY